MKNFSNAPYGVPGAAEPQTGRGVPNTDGGSGWRKATAGLAAVEQLANAGQRLAVPKTRAFVAVKRVGPYIGLKAGDMMLLDTLGAFTQDQDWEEGQRPIVWPSNAYLMEATGFSLSALKRHARRLVEIGVVSFQDSPNGKRWGRRGADGRIVEAYGFDLSPLSARVEEFERLHAELQVERELCKRLKRQITVSRRLIRARIEAALGGALRGPWLQLAGLFEGLLDRLPGYREASDQLERLLVRFRELQARVEAAYLNATQAEVDVEDSVAKSGEEALQTKEMNPSGVISEPHIPITKQLNSVTRNSSENEEAGDAERNNRTSDPDKSELEKWVAEVRTKRTALDIPTVMQACPEFTSWAHNLGEFVRDWGDLHRVAGQLRPMIGISASIWDVAQDRMGKQAATAALALVFEKHSAGEVASPGGYLRGMVAKAEAGELYLERSFYGRLGERAA